MIILTNALIEARELNTAARLELDHEWDTLPLAVRQAKLAMLSAEDLAIDACSRIVVEFQLRAQQVVAETPEPTV